MPKLTHFDKKGRAKMVDVSKKRETLREAVVRGSLFMNQGTFKTIMSGKIAKGDVLAVAKVAGIMAAKKTSEIIPMCHPLNLSHVEINLLPFEKENRIDIEAKVKIKGQTGVEMEGFVAIATAGLTIYDMCKAIDRGMVFSNIHLVRKTGGKSGTYKAPGAESSIPFPHDLKGDRMNNVQRGKVLAVNISEKKGTKKTNIKSCALLKDFGLKDDAHGGPWHRQVSLLANESIAKMKAKGLKVGYGDFAENITTEGVDLVHLPIGTEIRVGDSVLLRVTQIGKECHERCAIYYQAGDCVMPKEGIFAEVVNEGEVKAGDEIIIG